MSDISFKADFAALKAELIAEIQKQDGYVEQVAKQSLIEGKNVAHQLVRKDTGNLNDGIDRASTVERLAPCIWQWTLTSDAPYTDPQEFGPLSGAKVWAFNPFLRPGGAAAMAKMNEICDRVYNP